MKHDSINPLQYLIKYGLLTVLIFFISATLKAQMVRMVSGTVVNDANNSSAILDGAEVGTNTGNTLFVYIINSVNNVLRKITVGSNGTYSSTLAPGGTYRFVLSTQDYTVGASATGLTNQLPNGWVTTGEGLANTDDGTPNGSIDFPVIVGSVSNINFGIQRIPFSDSKNHTLSVQPVTNSVYPLTGVSGNPPLLSGSDAEDGTYTGNTGTIRDPLGVRINSLPTNGELWYDGVQVTSADLNSTLFVNPALFSVRFTGSGYLNTSFNYTYTDAAGFGSASPALYTINWSLPLPVQLSFFQVHKNNLTVLLNWNTSSENNNKEFVIERSADGNKWEQIGLVASKADNGNSSNKLDYTFTDKNPLGNANYYRLKQIDFDNKFEYSPIRVMRFDIIKISLSPNPAKNHITVNGLNGNEEIIVLDITGKIVLREKVSQATHRLNTSVLINGNYYVKVLKDNVNIGVNKLIVRN